MRRLPCRRRVRPLAPVLFVSLLLLAWHSKPCFIGTSTSFRQQEVHVHNPFQRKSRQGAHIILSACPPNVISLTDFVLETNFDKAEAEALAGSVAEATADKLWDMTEFEPLNKAGTPELPRGERWMDGVQFQAAARKLKPDASDAAIQAVFMVLARGNAGYIVKEVVGPVIAGWSCGPDGSFDSGAFQLAWAVSKANVVFAVWFLNVFAPFCTYFFFIRGPLKAFLGIDFLPGVPNFWDRGAPPAAADAAQAVAEALTATPPV